MNEERLKEIFREHGKFAKEYGGAVIVLSLTDLLSKVKIEAKKK